MINKREGEPESKDEDMLSDKLTEDWASVKPYDKVEREVFYSTINKDKQSIKNEEQKPEELKKDEEIKEINSPYNMNRFKKLMSEEVGQTKRSYTLRNITIRKMGELKILHPDINISLNKIVDMAINHYYDYIKAGGEFEE